MKEVNTWWYGFKEAEQLFYEGFVPDYNDFLSYYIYFVKGSRMCGIPLKDTERKTGALDYIRYWEENNGIIKYVHSGVLQIED